MKRPEIVGQLFKTAAMTLAAGSMVFEGGYRAQATGKVDNDLNGTRNRNTLVVNNNPDTSSTQNNENAGIDPESLQDGQKYLIQINQDPTEGLVYSAKEEDDPEALNKVITTLKVGTQLIAMYTGDGTFLVSGGALGGIENGTPTIYINTQNVDVTPIRQVP